MPPAILQAYVEMMPVMLARREMAMLRAAIYGTHWPQLKQADRTKILAGLERLANGDAPAGEGVVKIRSADDANRFFNHIARRVPGGSR